GASITGNTTIATTAGNTLGLGNSTGAVTVTGSSSSSFVLNGVTVSATEFNLLDGRDTALVDTTDAVNTAITGTGALGAGSITSGFGAIDTGADNITTSGTIGTAATTTFTGLGATFTGNLAANGGITLAANQNITTTSGTGTLTLNSTFSNASGNAILITPSYTGGATDLLTYNGLSIAAFSPSNGAGTDTVNGVSVGNMSDPGATITSSAFKIGTGWDT